MPDRRNPSDRAALGFVFSLIERRALVSVGLLMLVASLTEGAGLVLLVPLTQIVAEQPSPALGQWGADLARIPLAALLGGFLAVVILRALLMLAILEQRMALSRGLIRRLRTEAQQAIVAAEWRWLSGQRGADHGALIVGETERIGMQADRALDLATSAVTLLALLAAALWLSWQLTLATMALGAVTALAWIALRRGEEAHGDAYSAAHRRLQRHVADGLAHLRAARIAGAQERLLADFAETAGELERVERRFYAAANRSHVGLQIVAATMLVLLVWIGMRELALPLALFVPILAIFIRIIPLVGAMQQGWRAWRFCRPAIDTLRQTLSEARIAAEPTAPAGPPIGLADSIVFDRVCFAYPDRPRPVLDGFSHRFPAGKVIGVRGPSGSGKSTLADLLAGLVAPDGGTISIDGVALDRERRIRWRRQVAYVEQSPYLFDGSIADNLAWGCEGVERAALEAALRDASAEFVLRLPQGLDTPVGEVGRRLSGGERQRISLARALVRHPSLVILDEVSAALDPANETAIARSIERLRGRCTVVILGHRAALLNIVDEVVDLARDD